MEVTLLMKIDRRISPQRSITTMKMRSAAFTGLISIFAGVHCVKAQWKLVEYLYGIVSLSMWRTLTQVGSSVGRVPKAYHEQATKCMAMQIFPTSD